jgi:antitoxin YefM
MSPGCCHFHHPQLGQAPHVIVLELEGDFEQGDGFYIAAGLQVLGDGFPGGPLVGRQLSGRRPYSNRSRCSTLLRTDGRFEVTSVSATEARKRLYALIDEVGQSHEPLQITGKRGNAVLLSEEDWRAIQETLHLVSIPGMRESILEGMATDVSELSPDPGW